jgi:hypothetical protein
MRAEEFVNEHIVKHGSGYRLVSKKTGKNLGDFPTKSAAKKHEREVEYFKHANEEQLDELSFLGSPCTKDCSGHRAGYEWSKRKGGQVAQSPWSPSFNNGSQLYVDGK